MRIDAEGVHYRHLNAQIRAAIEGGAREIRLGGVRGQRYIGAGLDGGARIEVDGVAGNDLGVFMNGAEVIVNANAQDGVGNTMNRGKIIVRGDAGDIVGYSMRGGRVFVSGSVGSRAGIHMKASEERFPVVVIGRVAGDYLGEYMAGGVLAVLNLDGGNASPAGQYVGTGMHGGVIYLRGELEPHQVGAEVSMSKPDDPEWEALSGILGEFSKDLGLTGVDFRREDFVKVHPQTSRPYGTLYAY